MSPILPIEKTGPTLTDYLRKKNVVTNINERGNEMIEPKMFQRAPFFVEAIQVTAENLSEVATWCEGDVRQTEKKTSFIKVKVKRPLNVRQTRAFVGDWVLKAGTGFKVYPDDAFHKCFQHAEASAAISTSTIA